MDKKSNPMLERAMRQAGKDAEEGVLLQIKLGFHNTLGRGILDQITETGADPLPNRTFPEILTHGEVIDQFTHKIMSVFSTKKNLEELLPKMRVVKASTEGQKHRPLSKQDMNNYFKQVIAQIPPTCVILSRNDLAGLQKQMGDVLFYQLLRRTEIWTSLEGATFIEEFWGNHGRKT